MRKRYVVTMIAISFLVCGLSVQNASGISPSVVISQIQLGNMASASNEFIEVYNNSAVDIDVTNWCLYYASATSTQNGSKLACFLPEGLNVHFFIPSHSFAFAISNQLSLSALSLGSDIKFSAALSGTAGHVRLIDGSGGEIDKVGWGATAVSSEGASPAIVPAVGKVLQRKTVGEDIFHDSDINSNDFETAFPRITYFYGFIYEIQDLCLNLDGIQEVIPTNFTVDTAGNCSLPPVDICTNIDGLQIAMPAGYELDVNGACMPDMCANLANFQLSLPDGYKLTEDDDCILDLLPIEITELLANASGSDGGREFIELYNPNDIPVDLSLYRLKIGIDNPKLYSFPLGSRIESKKYASFLNSTIPFTLNNSFSKVVVMTADSVLVDESLLYNNPQEDVAWALVDDIWQYTNQPTPGSANVASYDELDDEAVVADSLKACQGNQYRSLETNRCRLLITVSSISMPCKDGQYRSEATNRCRNIASDANTLASCKVGQERNFETNRCRSIASNASVLAACKEGQERNPETNRCRSITGAVPTAAFAVEPIADTTGAFVGWWALGGIGIVALAYGGWEWRAEILQATQKLRTLVHFKK